MQESSESDRKSSAKLGSAPGNRKPEAGSRAEVNERNIIMMTSTNGEAKSRTTRESKDREAKASRHSAGTSSASSTSRRGTPEKGSAASESPRKTRQRRGGGGGGGGGGGAASSGEAGSHCLRSAGNFNSISILIKCKSISINLKFD